MTRPVGNLEKFSTVRHAHGFYRCVGNTARYSFPSSLKDLSALLEIALAKVILQHASLCVGITREDTETSQFVRLESINVYQCIEYHKLKSSTPNEYEQGLIKVLERQHSALWPDIDRLPPWKLIIMQSDTTSSTGRMTFDAMFAFHHAIADGLSGVAFHRTLVSALNTPSSTASLKSHILTIPKAMNLSPPLEKCVSFTNSWLYIIQQIWKEFGPRLPFTTLPPDAWTSTPPSLDSVKNYTSRLEAFFIAPELVPKILVECRKHNTTLTGLMQALAALSLAQSVPEAETFTQTCPFSLRHLSGTSPDAIVVQVSAYESTFPVPVISSLRSTPNPTKLSTILWSLAQSFKTELTREIASLPKNNIIGMIPYISNMHNFMLGKFGKKRGATYELSNAGAFVNEAGEGVEWKIERMMFSQSGSATGSAMAVSVASVKGGELSVCVTWLQGDIEEGIVKKVREGLERGLVRLGEGKELGG
ncbi:alcohol acetyltransferase [Tricladium varicosporioides]|nr:alcohol acetyltransferase [Hymenoscyphus varicosporioides]